MGLKNMITAGKLNIQAILDNFNYCIGLTAAEAGGEVTTTVADYATNAQNSATSAQTYANQASTSESNVNYQAGQVVSIKGNIETIEDNVEALAGQVQTNATNAQNSATSAQNSATLAEQHATSKSPDSDKLGGELPSHYIQTKESIGLGESDDVVFKSVTAENINGLNLDSRLDLVPEFAFRHGKTPKNGAFLQAPTTGYPSGEVPRYSFCDDKNIYVITGAYASSDRHIVKLDKFTGEVLLTSPDNEKHKLEYASVGLFTGTRLFVNTFWDDDQPYSKGLAEIDLSDLSIKSMRSTYFDGTRGMTFDGTHLYLASNNPWLYKVDQSNLESVSVVSGLAYSINDCCYAGGLIWCSCNDQNIRSFTTDLVLVDEIPTGRDGLWNLAFDGTRLWVHADNTGKILVLDLGAKTFDTVSGSSSYNPGRLAFDGKYMWLVAYDDDIRVYDINTLALVKTITGLIDAGDISFDGTHMWTVQQASNNYKLFRHLGY